jgi:predicted Zn-dependent protease with MMP-like domain
MKSVLLYPLLSGSFSVEKAENNMRISHKEFESIVEQALGRIPEMFRAQLNNLTMILEDRPSLDLLQEMSLPPDDTLFGVFTGIPLPERSVMEAPPEPDVILIFMEPLMAACHSREELEEEISITVVHEIAHYLGLSEDRLQELGYG